MWAVSRAGPAARLLDPSPGPAGDGAVVARVSQSHCPSLFFLFPLFGSILVFVCFCVPLASRPYAGCYRNLLLLDTEGLCRLLHSVIEWQASPDGKAVLLKEPTASQQLRWRLMSAGKQGHPTRGVLAALPGHVVTGPLFGCAVSTPGDGSPRWWRSGSPG